MIKYPIDIFYNKFISSIPSRKIRRLYLKSFLSDLDQDSHVQMRCKFFNFKNISIGKNNAINFGSILDARTFSISFGRNISFGPYASILSSPRSNIIEKKSKTIISDYCVIEYGVTICSGVKIGEGSVIKAGTMVSEDIEPYLIVGGNPIRKIANRNRNLKYKISYNPWLN